MTLPASALLRQIAVVAALLVASNFAMSPLARDAFVAGRLRIAKGRPAPGTLLVGSSVVHRGFDTAALAAALPPAARPVVNLGLHNSTPAEHYALLATALPHARHARLVVYGYFGLELVRPVPFDFTSLVGRRAMIYYAGADVAGPLVARLSAWDRLTFRLARPLPLLTERAWLWPTVEAVRRRLDSVGLPPAARTELGRVSDLRAMAEKDYDEADLRAYLRGRLPLAPAVELSIGLAKARGVRCVFVEMPVRPDFLRRLTATPLYGQFMRKLRADLKARGCEAISAADWVADPAAFSDEVHLAEPGRQAFTARLGAELAARKRPLVPSPGTAGRGLG